jgi:hypothetical protein
VFVYCFFVPHWVHWIKVCLYDSADTQHQKEQTAKQGESSVLSFCCVCPGKAVMCVHAALGALDTACVCMTPLPCAAPEGAGLDAGWLTVSFFGAVAALFVLFTLVYARMRTTRTVYTWLMSAPLLTLCSGMATQCCLVE